MRALACSRLSSGGAAKHSMRLSIFGCHKTHSAGSGSRDTQRLGETAAAVLGSSPGSSGGSFGGGSGGGFELVFHRGQAEVGMRSHIHILLGCSAMPVPDTLVLALSAAYPRDVLLRVATLGILLLP